jgi:hypothetical protein
MHTCSIKPNIDPNVRFLSGYLNGKSNSNAHYSCSLVIESPGKVLYYLALNQRCVVMRNCEMYQAKGECF